MMSTVLDHWRYCAALGFLAGTAFGRFPDGSMYTYLAGAGNLVWMSYLVARGARWAWRRGRPAREGARPAPTYWDRIFAGWSTRRRVALLVGVAYGIDAFVVDLLGRGDGAFVVDPNATGNWSSSAFTGTFMGAVVYAATWVVLWPVGWVYRHTKGRPASGNDRPAPPPTGDGWR